MTRLLDHPAISDRYFFPRPDPPPQRWNVKVDGDRVELACARIDRGRSGAVLHFHGNGEVVADWGDGFASALDANGVDAFFAEYRGYGGSGGRPSLAKLLEDALAVFDAVTASDRNAEDVVRFPVRCRCCSMSAQATAWRGSPDRLAMRGGDIASAPARERPAPYAPANKGDTLG